MTIFKKTKRKKKKVKVIDDQGNETDDVNHSIMQSIFEKGSN